QGASGHHRRPRLDPRPARAVRRGGSSDEERPRAAGRVCARQHVSRMSQTSARQRARNGGRRAPRVLLIGVALAALGVTFALGALVGRHLAHRPQPVSVASEPVRRPGPAPRRGGLSEPLPERAASQEKLTFYQTLTAPLGTAPATNADATSKAEPARPRPAAERPVPPPAPPATALAPRPARPANGA